jgi:hypothetical protein
MSLNFLCHTIKFFWMEYEDNTHMDTNMDTHMDTHMDNTQPPHVHVPP